MSTSNLLRSLSCRQASTARSIGLWMMALAVAGFFHPAGAQVNSFEPEISVGALYTDNVTYLEGADEGADDTVADFGVVLPWNREWRTGTFALSYDTKYQKYQEFSSLDNFSQELNFRVQNRSNRLTDWHLAGRFLQSQEQGNLVSNGNLDSILAPRTDRDVYGLDGGVESQLSEDWRMNTVIGVNAYRFDPIEGFAPGAGSVVIEDRNVLRGRIGMENKRSERVTIGFSYDYQITSLDLGGDERVQTLSLRGSRRPGEQSELTWGLGGFQRSQDQAGIDDDFGFSGELRLRREFQASVFDLRLEHSPSSGGTLEGTSTNSMVEFALMNRSQRHWDWQVLARYTLRESVDQVTDDVAAASGIAYLERALDRDNLGLRIDLAVVSQTGESDDALNGSFLTAGARLVWYPKGRESRAAQ